MTTTLQSGLTLTVNAKVLREALLDLAPIYQKKPSLPILDNIHVWVGPDYLALTGNDLDHALTRYVPISACDSPAGTFLLDYRKLKALLKGKRSTVELDCSLALFDGDHEEYPPPPSATGKPFAFTGEAISAVKRAAYAVSSDPTRYILGGVYLDEDRGQIVATDGRRIHVESVSPCVPTDSILPANESAGRLIRRLPERSATASLNPRATVIRMEWGGWGIYWSKLIEGTFPNYPGAMPRGEPLDLAWIRTTDALRQAVDYVCAIRKEFEVRHIKLTPQGADLRVQAEGHGKKVVFDTTIAGAVVFNPIKEPIATAFNPVFLQQSLEEAHSLFLKDEVSAGIIHTPTATAIVMPLRLN